MRRPAPGIRKDGIVDRPSGLPLLDPRTPPTEPGGATPPDGAAPIYRGMPGSAPGPGGPGDRSRVSPGGGRKSGSAVHVRGRTYRGKSRRGRAQRAKYPVWFGVTNRTVARRNCMTMTVWQRASDPELISAVRGGDLAAWSVLCDRHLDSARRLARELDVAEDAEELVARVAERVLEELLDGTGPDVALRAHLLARVRSEQRSSADPLHVVLPPDPGSRPGRTGPSPNAASWRSGTSRSRTTSRRRSPRCSGSGPGRSRRSPGGRASA